MIIMDSLKYCNKYQNVSQILRKNKAGRKVGLIDLHIAGFPPTFNLLTNKLRNNTAKCSEMRKTLKWRVFELCLANYRQSGK